MKCFECCEAALALWSSAQTSGAVGGSGLLRVFTNMLRARAEDSETAADKASLLCREY